MRFVQVIRSFLSLLRVFVLSIRQANVETDQLTCIRAMMAQIIKVGRRARVELRTMVSGFRFCVQCWKTIYARCSAAAKDIQNFALTIRFVFLRLLFLCVLLPVKSKFLHDD